MENKVDNHTDSKVRGGANMGPTWVLSASDGLHVGPMNIAIREVHIIPSLHHYIQWKIKTVPSNHTIDEQLRAGVRSPRIVSSSYKLGNFGSHDRPP